MTNINDLQEQFENLIKQGQELLEKMKEERVASVSKTKRWKPKDREEYWFIQNDGLLYRYSDGWKNGVSDKGRYKLGNCFKTEQEAQKELDRRFAELELLDLADWEKDKPCYEIEYNFKEKCFEGDVCSSYSCYSPYRFSSKESCQKAIDTLGEDKLKLIFRIED